jgi:hypothetical protein
MARAIDGCMNCHTSVTKKISIFFGKVPPDRKKFTKIFSNRGMTIHTPVESPGRVDKKYVVFKRVMCFNTQKNVYNTQKLLPELSFWKYF